MIRTSTRTLAARRTLPVKPYYDESRISGRRVEIHRPAPWDLRLILWIGRQIYQPRRIVRLLYFLWQLSYAGYNQARLFTVAVCSHRVDDAEYETRQILCRRCPHYDNGYCSSCRCPRWPLSRLDRKNRYSGWKCPEQKHPGVYVVYRKPPKRTGCGGSTEQN